MDKKAKTENDEPIGELLESIDDILSVDSFEYKTVKGWGGRPVKIGSLTAGQMITFLENNDKPGMKRRNGLMLISLSLVTKDGTRLVNPDNEEEINAAITKLKSKESKTNGRIVQEILQLNGMDQKDAAAIAKNASSETSAGDSHTS